MTILWAIFGHISNLHILLFIKYRNLIHDQILLITLSYSIASAIEGNIWMNWIMNQVLIKFGSLKIDISGDTMMCSDAIYHQPSYNKLNNFSWLYIDITTHPHISTNINFESTKIYHNLVYDAIHPNFTFNSTGHQIWQCYGKYLVIYQISIFYK